MKPTIALVGRPNVGKSTLFNRLTKSRDALVADQPGLTRDRHYGHGKVGEKPYLVIDTGGFEPVIDEGIMFEMAKQSGRFLDRKWENYQTWAGWAGIEPVYVPENREIGEIQTLQQRALREFYLRPSVLVRHMLTTFRHPVLFRKYAQGALALLGS